LVLLGSTACLNQGAKSKTPGTRQHTETKAHEKKGTNDVMDEAMHTDGSWVTGDENGEKEPPLANVSGEGATGGHILETVLGSTKTQQQPHSPEKVIPAYKSTGSIKSTLFVTAMTAREGVRGE